MTSKDIMVVLIKAIEHCVNNIILPVGKNIVTTLLISLSITVGLFICSVLDIYTFLDWKGSLVANVILLIQCFIERRSNDEVLRLYGTLRLRLDQVKEWQERPGKFEGLRRLATSVRSTISQVTRRHDSPNDNNDGRPEGGVSGSSEFEWDVDIDGQHETDTD